MQNGQVGHEIQRDAKGSFEWLGRILGNVGRLLDRSIVLADGNGASMCE